MSHLDNHLYSRDAKIVDFLVTSIEVARGFIVLNRPKIADEVLTFSTSAVIHHYADKYSIKIYDEDERGENFTTIKRSMDIIEILRGMKTVKMYLYESTLDLNGKEGIEVSVVIDKCGTFMM